MHFSKQHKQILLLLLKNRETAKVGLTLIEIVTALQESFMETSEELKPMKNVYPSVSRSMKTLRRNGFVERSYRQSRLSSEPVVIRWSITTEGSTEALRIRRKIIRQFEEFRYFL